MEGLRLSRNLTEQERENWQKALHPQLSVIMDLKTHITRIKNS